jgi:pimeloyl-ACP methyl ester carboxylesterase
MTELYKVKLGSGPRVIFVNGDGPSQGCEESFKEQRGLADKFELIFFDRHGFGNNLSTDHGDYIADAQGIADVLGQGAHLVGHSGGGLACLLAAHHRPDAVRSLTLIEPPAVAIARGNPAVENFIKRFQYVYEKAEQTTPHIFWAEFIGAFGFEKPTELKLTEKELNGIRATMTMNPPFYELEIPLDRLIASRFPKFIVSGAWNNVPEFVWTTSGIVFNLICDVLQTRIGAQRSVFEGASHFPHIETPKLFNNQLRAFLKSV